MECGYRMRCPEISAGNSTKRMLEARYAYYRRCQVLRGNGEQCKAPSEKGTHICYAHARQKAMLERRERERQAVLEEAAAELRRRGRAGFQAAAIYADFNAIQVTIAVMAQALIDGRIDSKTAGRMAWELQTASKLLWFHWKAAARATPRRSPEKRAGESNGALDLTGGKDPHCQNKAVIQAIRTATTPGERRSIEGEMAA